jgi:tetratricopeptide (TPR) repeat protein
MGLPCAAQEIDNLLARGDSLYELHDYEQSGRHYRRAGDLDSSRFEPFWKLGRSLNLKGETASKDSQLVIYEEARDSEKHALGLDEGHADAHFQLARALGKIALFKGIFKSASLAKQVRAECLRALEIDSLHDGAWHILGRWHREVGKKTKILRIPMGLGAANKKDALAFMKKAVSLKPDYINHRLEMGLTFLRFGDDDAARLEFEACLELPSQRPLDEKYKEEAKKYLAEMDRK